MSNIKMTGRDFKDFWIYWRGKQCGYYFAFRGNLYVDGGKVNDGTMYCTSGDLFNSIEDACVVIVEKDTKLLDQYRSPRDFISIYKEWENVRASEVVTTVSELTRCLKYLDLKFNGYLYDEIPLQLGNGEECFAEVRFLSQYRDDVIVNINEAVCIYETGDELEGTPLLHLFEEWRLEYGDQKTIIFEGNDYDVPTWVNWVAKDGNGAICGYQFKPHQDDEDEQWVVPRGDSMFLVSAGCWKNSLIKV
jgi:hypothetical protein